MKMENWNECRERSEHAVREAGCPVWIKDERTGRCYALPYGELVVGRKDDVANDVPVVTEDLFMSRRHAVIAVRRDLLGVTEVLLRPYSAEVNPVFVLTETEEGGTPEYRPLGENTEFELYHLSRFILGKSLFTLHYASENGSERS